jgi:hypothetical protein
MAALGRNQLAALACAAIAGVLCAITFTFEQMPESITRGMGAELFPRLVLGVVFVLCMVLALEPNEPKPAEPTAIGRLLGTAAALGGFMALLDITGMLAAMFLFLVVCGRMWGERRLWLLLLTSVAVTGAVWAVFVRGFGIQLPAGMLGAFAGR